MVFYGLAAVALLVYQSVRERMLALGHILGDVPDGADGLDLLIPGQGFHAQWSAGPSSAPFSAAPTA